MKCEIQLQRIHYCEAKRSFQYRCSARVSVRGCGMLSGSVGVVRECEREVSLVGKYKTVLVTVLNAPEPPLSIVQLVFGKCLL